MGYATHLSSAENDGVRPNATTMVKPGALMDDSITRRELLKTIAIAGAGAALPAELLHAGATVMAPPPATLAVRPHYATGDILELYSTSDVFIPPRGRSFQKF